MGGSEILLIFLAVLVLFGADKLPEFARSLGKGIREVKKATDEIKDEITKETTQIKSEINNNLDDFKMNDLKKDVQDSVDSFKFSDLDEPKKDAGKTS